MEISSLGSLGSVLTRIQQIPSVMEVKRYHQVRNGDKSSPR